MATATQMVERLEKLREGAPKRNANVRTLARFAANSSCPLATLGFAARVDFDKLLAETKYAAPFGQSPFAFRRGNRFEERLREDRYRPTMQLFEEHLGYTTKDSRVENLRDGFARSRDGMQARAARTEELIATIVKRDKNAPNLIDGAVLAREVGGIPSFFEADAVAARFAQPILAGEIKSFPTVDGQADPDKVGAAIAQVSIYILLLKDMVERLGGDPSIVSTEALIITPKNTGLQPTLSKKDVGREVERAARILDQAPRAEDVVSNISDDVPSFGEIALESGNSETQRIESALCIAERVGTRYRPECLSGCGFSRLCRERAHRSGDPARISGQLERLLPGIETLDRAAELAGGARPTIEEEPAAAQLIRASTLLERFSKSNRKAGSKR